jgi:abequosyltransferase
MATLSICIPTFNRAPFLAELLDSIVSQSHPEVEVVVSDDASPDDTAEVAKSYGNRIPNYRVIRQPANIGLDRNFLAVVEAASGDFVWLMGDDDRLEPGGIDRVLEALERWPGVSGLTLGVIDYDKTMQNPVGVRGMPPTQLVEDVEQVFNQLSHLLGFMSALVFDRRKWLAVAQDPSVQAFHNYYVQVYVIGRVIERFGQWGVVQEPCVGFRTGNDQFKTKFGWLQRLKIDVEAYGAIAEALFRDSPEVKTAMRQRVFDTHVMARVYNAKTNSDPTPGVVEAGRYLYGAYGDLPRFWTRALPALLAPKWLMRGVRTGYRTFSRGSGTARARRATSM